MNLWVFRKVDKWWGPGEAGRGRHRSLCLRHLARCYRPLLQQVLKLMGLELTWHDRPGRYHVPNTHGVQVGQNKTARPVHPLHASASTWRGGKHGAKVSNNIKDVKNVYCHYLLILKMLVKCLPRMSLLVTDIQSALNPRRRSSLFPGPVSPPSYARRCVLIWRDQDHLKD